MSSLYEGCWHKLDRAKYHVDELKRAIWVWADLQTKPPFQLRLEFDSDLDYVPVRVVALDPLPTDWSLITGDALSNFRAALDYLAHDLVGRGSKPHLKGTGTPQFIIGKDRSDFAGRAKKRMPGITNTHWNIVESYQPYWWGPVEELHPFFMLDYLVNRDKHRKLQPISPKMPANSK